MSFECASVRASMDASFVTKRPLDPSPSTDPTSKRRHHPTSQPPPPPPSVTSTSAVGHFFQLPETIFRILCPAAKTAALVGQGGAVIRHLCELTGAKIYIDDPVPSSDERIIVVVADTKPKNHSSTEDDGSVTERHTNETNNSSVGECDEGSLAQQALIRVFEKIARVDEEERRTGNLNDGSNDDAAIKGLLVCRLLAPSNLVGCVIGRGGKIVEKIRQESGAQIRVLHRDHIPPCVSPGDELIQITGNFSAVKKALLSVSGCLQDNPRVDAINFGSAQMEPCPQRGYASGVHAADYHARGYSSNPGPEKIGANHRVVEEEVVFKLLCQADKVGSLIGKGGSIIRTLQSETGASIKIADPLPNSDERVVVISARENSEQRHSPAQDTVIRVHNRIAEIGFEPGAAVVARLLIHSQQIGYLLGKGGFVIAEMRRATGASIRVFQKEQVPNYGYHNDEVVQVIGNMQSVQDALFHITSRLRETIFPMRPPFPSITASPYLPPFPEMPPHQFRPIHNTASPSPVGLPHNMDRSSQPLDHRPPFSHSMNHIAPNSDRVPYPYGGERPGHGPTFDIPPSPRSWTPQAFSSGNPRGMADNSSGLTSGSGPFGSGDHRPALTCMTVEIVIPQTYLNHVYGENKSNLGHIRQISGANVVVHDPKPGATEGVVMVSGTSDQMRAAQTLIQAFIFCGHTTP